MVDKLVELSSEKKRLIVECIQDGLKEFQIRNEEEALQEFNGLGLYSLNYIFKQLGNISRDLFTTFAFKRGPFEFKFLYDNETQAIITFTSKNVIKKLSNRVKVKRPHYNDAFVLYNAEIFEEPQQICMFESEDTDEDARIKIQAEIQQKIGELNPKFHIMIIYDIAYKQYLLKDVSAEIWSEHYYPIAKERLGNYISYSNSDDIIDGTNENTYTSNSPKVDNRVRFGLKIKPDNGIKRESFGYEDNRREITNRSSNKK